MTGKNKVMFEYYFIEIYISKFLETLNQLFSAMFCYKTVHRAFSQLML